MKMMKSIPRPYARENRITKSKVFKNLFRKKYLNGSATLEMAYIMPFVIFMIISLILVVFYFHDKNILIGAGKETVIIGSELKRQPLLAKEVDLNQVFQDKVGEKLLLFSDYDADIQEQSGKISLNVQAEKGWMSLTVFQSTVIPKPERSIRRVRRLGSLLSSGEGGEED